MSGTPLSIVAFIVVILVCVGIHEAGHFVAAKISGIRVDEFSIGFGPRLASWGKGETTYSLRLLPLGGFVRMAGMLGLPGEADAGPRNFYRASIPRRLFVMFAGIGSNLVLALVLPVVALMLPISSSVVAGGAAQSAGIHDGDSLISIDGSPIDHASQANVARTTTTALQATRGAPAVVVYRDSGGTQRTTTIHPRLGLNYSGIDNPDCDAAKFPQGDSYITALNGTPVGSGDASKLLQVGTRVSGVSLTPSAANPCAATQFTAVVTAGSLSNLQTAWRIGVALDSAGLPFSSAVSASWHSVIAFIPDTVESISLVASTPGSGGAFGPNGLQGPVGIATEAGQSAQQGLASALLFIALISLNLGYLNLVPIPFLDGGKILVVLIEAVRRKRMAPEREALIYLVGLAMIILLVAFVTIGNLRNH